MKKIIIGILMLLLLMGVASAFDIDSLTPIDNYNNFQKGCSTYTTNNHRYIYIEKAGSDYKTDWFTSDSELSVTDKGNNIYYFEYPLFKLWGYEEIVTIDGEPYLISINQDSKLSPSEQSGFLKDLQDFNKLNNLEPIAV